MSSIASEHAARPAAVPRQVVVERTRGDRIFRRLATVAGSLTFVILVLIGLFLLQKALPAFRQSGLKFFTETKWITPPRGNTYGVASLLFGTVVIALIALVIAMPVSLCAALFITEYAPRWLRGSPG